LQGINWRKIRSTLKQIKAPTTANELDVTPEGIVNALEMAARIRPERYTILHKLNLSREACERVARNTGVIK
jgi:glycerol-1-phosphate dehydrogenase [NAD(P)+]